MRGRRPWKLLYTGATIGVGTMPGMSPVTTSGAAARMFSFICAKSCPPRTNDAMYSAAEGSLNSCFGAAKRMLVGTAASTAAGVSCVATAGSSSESVVVGSSVSSGSAATTVATFAVAKAPNGRSDNSIQRPAVTIMTFSSSVPTLPNVYSTGSTPTETES